MRDFAIPSCDARFTRFRGCQALEEIERGKTWRGLSILRIGWAPSPMSRVDYKRHVAPTLTMRPLFFLGQQEQFVIRLTRYTFEGNRAVSCHPSQRCPFTRGRRRCFGLRLFQLIAAIGDMWLFMASSLASMRGSRQTAPLVACPPVEFVLPSTGGLLVSIPSQESYHCSRVREVCSRAEERAAGSSVRAVPDQSRKPLFRSARSWGWSLPRPSMRCCTIPAR
jgi:hypothetical protein